MKPFKSSTRKKHRHSPGLTARISLEKLSAIPLVDILLTANTARQIRVNADL